MSRRPKEFDDPDRQAPAPASPADETWANQEQLGYAALELPPPLPPPQFDGMASAAGRRLTKARLEALELLAASAPQRERFIFAVGWILGALAVAVGVYALR